MKALKLLPSTLFRVKTKEFNYLRAKDLRPLPNTTLAIPRTDERWFSHQNAPNGMSLFPFCKKLRGYMRYPRHKFVIIFKKGMLLPDDLMLYQTSRYHFSLEPSLPTDLKGKARCHATIVFPLI